jgi:hypothetical protein
VSSLVGTRGAPFVELHIRVCRYGAKLKKIRFDVQLPKTLIPQFG